MSGPQFMHIETYARAVSKLRKQREATRASEGKFIDRKLTVEEICAEAARLEGHCPHVDAPAAPVLIHGMSPDKVPALLEARIDEANAAIKAAKAAMKRGTRASGTRAIRADTHTLFTMVASHPIPWSDAASGEANFENSKNRELLRQWEASNVAWAKKKAEQLCLDLVSVVRHEDEAHPHLHFLFIPRGGRMEARGSHPGYMAQKELVREESEDDKVFRRRMNKAYVQAMRAFQDDYFASVGIESGLLRTGPKRQRLSRDEYLAEKDAGRARALASLRSKELKKEVEQTQEDIAEAKDVLAMVGADAVQAIIRSRELETQNDRAESALVAKQTEARSLDDLLRMSEALQAEHAQEKAALIAAQAERAEAEAYVARVRSEAEHVLAETERNRALFEAGLEKLERDRKELAKQKREGELVLASERAAVAQEKIELDAVAEGIEAYAEGRLLFNPANRSREFSLADGATPENLQLRDRLVVVKDRLLPMVTKLDAALSRRAAKLNDALKAAISSWASGLLEGVGEAGPDGRPTFDLPNSPEADRLLEKISPFREAVARVISTLPDRGLVAAVKRGLLRFGTHLNAAEQAEAQEFKRNLAMLERQRGKERE